MNRISWRERQTASRAVRVEIARLRTIRLPDTADRACELVIAAAWTLPPEMHQLRREAALLVVDRALPHKEAVRMAAELMEGDIERPRVLIERAERAVELGGLTLPHPGAEDPLRDRVVSVAERLIRRLARIHPDDAHRFEADRRAGLVGRLQSKAFNQQLSERLGDEFIPTKNLILRDHLVRVRNQPAPPFGSPGFAAFYGP